MGRAEVIDTGGFDRGTLFALHAVTAFASPHCVLFVVHRPQVHLVFICGTDILIVIQEPVVVSINDVSKVKPIKIERSIVACLLLRVDKRFQFFGMVGDDLYDVSFVVCEEWGTQRIQSGF